MIEVKGIVSNKLVNFIDNSNGNDQQEPGYTNPQRSKTDEKTVLRRSVRNILAFVEPVKRRAALIIWL
jgi:hypothetical protein